MRIALLQCDHVAPQFREVAGGDYDTIFKNYLARYAPPVDLEPFDVTAETYPDSLGAFDAFLSTGSKFSVYDDEPWVRTLKAFVKDLHEQDKTFIGICFGHQMIAEALGGKVAKSLKGWGIGVHTFGLKEKEGWMQPPLNKFNILMSCQDQVEVLPRNSKVLAGSDFCPVGMYRVGDHFLGIQGHPEFSVPYAEALMEARVERIGEATVTEAKTSLSKPPHQEELTSWILRFIERGIRQGGMNDGVILGNV